MRRHSLVAPITVIVTGLIIIVVLLGTPAGQSSAPLTFAYTAAEETATANAYVPPAGRTATSVAQTVAVNEPANTSNEPAATATVTSTRSPTATTQATTAPAAATATRTLSPTETPSLPTNTPLPPTETPIAALECRPATPLLVEGEGPPNAGLLLLFDERIVGGGTVRSNGTFSLRLVVGDEPAGVYPVVVQVRGTDQVLLDTTCAVPATTPTPAPFSRGP